MKGIASISGNTSPRINESNYYEVKEYYSGTQLVSDADIKWKLYAQRADSSWRELKGPLKTGSRVTYKFPQKWYGKRLMIEAYLFNPERKAKPGLIIAPTPGEPEITKAEILDAEGKPLKDKPHFLDTVILRATTVNMLGADVVFSLWENETFSDDYVWGKQTLRVQNSSGIVEATLTLNSAIKNSSGILNEDWQQQLFLLVETPSTIEESGSQDAITTNQTASVAVKGGAPKTNNSQQQESGAVVEEQAPQISNCGEKYCIKIGDKSELIREINIRLAGFGGNVPTDEFTDRTEKMIKQFQRDYLKVPETGKVCGNTLRAIDDFGSKYKIPFNRIKCKCGYCSGFGNGKFSEQAQDSGIREMYRKYEYPGIHRTIYWATKALMHYFSSLESGLGYKVGDISSGYRCHVDNTQNRRSSTNHMGKALDLHIYRTSDNKRAGGKDRGADEGRDLFVKYSNAKINWTTSNEISLEPRNIAPTWVHVDVREFEVKYLEDRFFANDSGKAEGDSIFSTAFKDYSNTCTCGGAFNSETTQQQLANQPQGFDIEDAEAALKVIYDKYGKEMAIKVERIYRWETNHFQSKQYRLTGTGGMEAHGSAPNYGWNGEFFQAYPEYSLMGLTSMKEGAGLSAEGGNQQDTVNAKQFIVFPSVEGAMMYLAEYISRYGGNHGRWYSNDAAKQQLYKSKLEGVIPRIVNTF